jgi:Zn-dependent peptidase ImmA (M78 family)
MRRGFKTEAHDVARQVRDELGLSPLDPLDPWRLAEHLDIPVWPLSRYRHEVPEVVDVLSGSEESAFSAMIAFVGSRRVIVHNDAHAPTRQRADISHEIAHALLLHRPHLVRAGEPPAYDSTQEEEASWLGGVLLVPEEACLDSCRRQQPLAEAAAAMGVSAELMRWRINKTGAHERVVRARRARAR